MKASIKLTVFFDGTFWVGVFERVHEESFEITKVVFGSEPKDYEVYDFLLKRFNRLQFDNTFIADRLDEKKMNPKRLQREIRNATENRGIGTKAQNALKLQYEANKEKRRIGTKEKKEEEKERQFELRQEKKKKKHKGQ